MFALNQATRFGGSISLAEPLYQSDFHSMLRATSCSFLGSTSRSGGAFYAEYDRQIILTYCHVENNQADENGGVAFLRQLAHMEVISSLVQSNRASHGGAFYVKEEASLIIEDSLIETCSSAGPSGLGGAVFLENYAALAVHGSSFKVHFHYTIRSNPFMY